MLSTHLSLVVNTSNHIRTTDKLCLCCLLICNIRHTRWQSARCLTYAKNATYIFISQLLTKIFSRANNCVNNYKVKICDLLFFFAQKSGIRYASNTLGKSTPSTKLDTNANIMQVKPTRKLSIQQETMYTLSPKRTLSSASAITPQNPDNLPHLPLPKLEDTMDKYLKSVQPLLSSEKFLKTTKIVEDFKRGIGAQLHDLLEFKASRSENWLADWWLTVGYLSWRSPVVIWSNPGLYLPTRFFENDFQWCRFTARCIWATLKYKQMIDYNEIPTEKAGKYPLDMSQYKKIFGTCRIPAPEVDRIEYNPKSRHIVVAFKNGVSSYYLMWNGFISVKRLNLLFNNSAICFDSFIKFPFMKNLRKNSCRRTNWPSNYCKF